VPQIRAFLDNGGTVVAIGSSARNLATHLEMPVGNHLLENGEPLSRAQFFTPGSVLSARIDPSTPFTRGMSEETHVYFDNSPVFRLGEGAEAAGVRRLAWFDSDSPLRSGWAWGQHYLENGVIALEATVGTGRAVLVGPDILKRAQPHGTFKLLLNAIVHGGRR
jgi:hypothetical protein